MIPWRFLSTVVAGGLAGAWLGSRVDQWHQTAISPVGTVADMYAASCLGCFAGLLLPVLAVAALIWLAASPRSQVALGLLFALPAFLGSCVAVERYNAPAGSWRSTAFRRIAERGAPVLAALREYEIKHGSVPEQLTGLVPEYLSEVPGTGVGAWSHFVLVGGGPTASSWHLCVYTSEGMFDFSAFCSPPTEGCRSYYPAPEGWCHEVD